MSETGKVLGCTVCALVVLSASVASGDAITYLYDSTVDNPLGPFAVGVGDTFSLPQYNDPRPLEGVEVEITATAVSGNNIWDNESASGGWAEVTMGAEITVSSQTPSAPAVIVVIPEASERDDNLEADDPNENGPLVIFGPYTMNADFADGINPPVNDSVRVDTAGATDNQVKVLLAAMGDDLSDWIGSGNVTWDFTSNLRASNQSNLPLGQGQSDPPTYQITARVTYNIVPEPSCLAALGLGLPALLLRRRSRK